MKNTTEKGRLNKIKAECHKLMDIIWENDKKNKYWWVRMNCGINHFSTEKDYGKVFAARTKLYKLALERGKISEDDINFIFKTL